MSQEITQFGQGGLIQDVSCHQDVRVSADPDTGLVWGAWVSHQQPQASQTLWLGLGRDGIEGPVFNSLGKENQ